MKTIIESLSTALQASFEKTGVSTRTIEVSYSRRPDLCDFQCNAALKLGKEVGMSPFELAKKVVEDLEEHSYFEKIEAAQPGFINMTLSETYLIDQLEEMSNDEYLGVEPQNPRKIIVDFGGANVAKALHVGHLRSAVIGESIIRILRMAGHEVIGDIHMGDWGLQMGLVIEMLREEAPQLIYFQEAYEGPYPEEAPFTIEGLTSLYTKANIKSKSDPAFRDRAAMTTAQLQQGHPAYGHLWGHILKVSKEDLKKNYGKLQVHFDLWLGESDAEPAIPLVMKTLRDKRLLRKDEGALVVDVARETDNKPMPPCIIQKENGASLYATTDLATLYQRMATYEPHQVIYVVDKRQDLHFEQVFRIAKAAEIVPKEVDLTFIGFGTMNGTDGKPFKTRDGGVMSLKDLIDQLISSVLKRLSDYSHLDSKEEQEEVALKVGVGALKYADLCNLPERNYVFDLQQFSSFEGKTGPYLQYAVVRISSILGKLESMGMKASKLSTPKGEAELALMKKLVVFNSWVNFAAENLQPTKISDYVFDLCQAFNRFYHEVHVLQEEKERQASLMALLYLTRQVLEKGLFLLGIDAIEKM